MPSDAALENLARIGQLDKVPFSSELMARMLATARSRLIDAQRSDNSAETRFDCAYTPRSAPSPTLHCWRTVTELRPASLGIIRRRSSA